MEVVRVVLAVRLVRRVLAGEGETTAMTVMAVVTVMAEIAVLVQILPGLMVFGLLMTARCAGFALEPA